MNTHALRAFLLRAALLASFPLLPAQMAVQAQVSPAAPPVAPVRPVTDTYFGTTLTDPYRWMEKLDAPEVKSWFRGQADYAQSVLHAIPGRDALAAEIKALDGVGTSVGEVQIAGGHIFYTKVRPSDNTPKLYVRDSLHGRDRLLLDPDKFGKEGGAHYALDYYTPSLEGSVVACGISRGGSEQSVLHILDVTTGKERAETIDRTRFGGVSWFPGGRAFVYDRQQPLTPALPPMEDERKIKVFLHTLGTDPKTDQPLLGYGLSPQMPMTADEYAYVSILPDAPYAVASVVHGVAPELTVYVCPTASMTRSDAPWQKIADVSDAVTSTATHGGSLFLLSHKGALRYQVLRLSLAHPDLAKAETVVPEDKTVVTAVAPAQDALYIQKLDGGISRLFRLPYRGGTMQEIPLSYKGAVDGLVTDYRRPGALFLETAWTHSALWYEYDPKTQTVADTRLKPLSPVDMSGYESLEVKAKSADGTEIPLSIIFKKGLALDGSHPALLDGYGSYGEVLSPFFNPTRIPWLERGGVLATAHVRGGGEYGEGWHLAGKEATKPHTWEDFLACGQYLIDQGYTSPAHLAGEGTSAGGITIGRAITARPDLFGAALIRVGSVNALRSELSPNGPPNVPEFGTFTTEAGFQALYAMDAYLHVVDGVKYPAILVETGINDPRVASWEPAKMAARLQAATGSGKPVLLRVDYDAGHGMGSTKAQGDDLLADEYAFLLWQLGDPSFQPKATAAAPDTPETLPNTPAPPAKAPGTIGVISPITVNGE